MSDTTGGIETAIYDAIAFHWWSDGTCHCGWVKPPHSVGHRHHLADLSAAAVRAHLLSDAVVERAAKVLTERRDKRGVDIAARELSAALAAAVGGDTE